ncbi:MAG: phosphodiester glycosidase family protein [Anaerolineae bacterium]|nr:phosphodiester glycosidase family protein [Anaerolineae bacterium]MDW8068321.1 phosphodiester glycosidase family protein [Anaerolineae bacterium]
MTRSAPLCGLLLLVALFLACRWLPAPSPTPTPTAPPTLPPTPTPEPPDTGWRAVEDGVELRQIRVALGEGIAERTTLVRLNPARVHFRVLYTPGEGQRISEWMSTLQAAGPSPLLVVNGGYFTSEYLATGLVISNGRVYGTSYSGFGGMFAVLPGGRVEVRWLVARPYTPTEVLVEAVQSFPVLIRPGGILGFPSDADAGQTARRTVVAQDQSGRILFMVAQDGFFSLHALARWLLESDLELDTALNLDGGQSTGLYLHADDGTTVQIDSGVPVPVVIVAGPYPP